MTSSDFFEITIFGTFEKLAKNNGTSDFDLFEYMATMRHGKYMEIRFSKFLIQFSRKECPKTVNYAIWKKTCNLADLPTLAPHISETVGDIQLQFGISLVVPEVSQSAKNKGHLHNGF